MKTCIISAGCAVFVAAMSTATWAGSPNKTGAGGGPSVDLPKASEDDEPTKDTDLTRGLQAQRLRAAAALRTSLGGYAEMHFTRAMPKTGDDKTTIDFHRLVLFVAHNFNNELQFYSEIEVEHAFSGDGKPGEVGLEQAFIDYKLSGDKLGLRAGIVLVPMGIINQWHEPPVFHGVERPMVDKSIIPSTWREGGIGLVGKPMPGLSFELYLLGGLNALKFSSSSGIRGGRQQVAKARADGLAVTGRVEYEPRLGLVIGGSFYAGMAGKNTNAYFDSAGSELDLDVPVVGGAVDMRWRFKGIEARAVVAGFSIGDTSQLRNANDSDGNPIGADAASQILGGYVEIAYDVLRLAGKHKQQLLPFARYERYDTMFRVDGRPRTAADHARGVTDLVFGLSYRPIPQVVFKADVILRQPDGADNTTLASLGIGTMF